ncbi:hypothetical protein HDA37_001256 [Pseudonocardia antarctica]|uniref:PD-(D/E)XK nuclease superfamily protein n=1 Tax=Pseudonocardia alni TaxID=33907 RepID=A0A852W0F2_PSEA5|nr:hypothetical protein [Pseudonocardia antarctica]
MTVALGHILPLERENRWSDLLAVLIERDSKAASKALGIEQENWKRVRREHGVTSKDRVDLILESDGTIEAVIEVKLLSGLGPTQLDRYRRAFPHARHHILISLGRLRLDIERNTDWRCVTWEQVLASFAQSADKWVAETATDWRVYLDQVLPSIEADTQWNSLVDGEDFVLAMRARGSWVFDNLVLPDGVEADFVQSSSGVSWVVRVFAQTLDPSYQVLADAEETLPNRNWPKFVTPEGPRPRGPSVLVTLLQSGVSDSRSFNWEHLYRLWQLMSERRGDWASTAARPRADHDREAIDQLRAAGAPALLGAGYGDAQARISGTCMFGARYRIAADASLREIAAELGKAASLVHELAAVPFR